MKARVLITGAGGFIGSHLAELCVEKGYEVCAFVHYNSEGRCGWLDFSKHRRNIKVISGDVRDYDSVSRAIEGCNIVFHLAALIGIPYSYVSPLAYVKTNVEGTYNVLEASRNHNVERVVITSTSETYGTAQYVPIDEKHPAVGQSPYAATKVGADQLALSYYRSFELPVWIARPFNTYGPRQSARAFIPSVIAQLLAGRTIRVGNLATTRDLTFVKDTATGFWAICMADSLVGTATNIGANAEIGMGDLLRKIAEIVGAPSRLEVEIDNLRLRPNNSEVERLCCDNTRITQCTDWRPAHTLNMGITETIEWMREHIDAYKPEIYNI